jgi:hypothetical protein
LLQRLSATPDRVAELTRGLSPGQLTRRPAEGEWSVGEIVNHLFVGERDVIFPRLKRMLLEESPSFPSSVSSRAGFAAAPESRNFAADLAAFRKVREETLALLETLADSDWQRTGTTPTRGTLTIEAYGRYLAEHDAEHLVQLETTRHRLAV